MSEQASPEVVFSHTGAVPSAAISLRFRDEPPAASVDGASTTAGLQTSWVYLDGRWALFSLEPLPPG
jgi:hypothetical protein